VRNLPLLASLKGESWAELRRIDDEKSFTNNNKNKDIKIQLMWNAKAKVTPIGTNGNLYNQYYFSLHSIFIFY
jgi:hypothetical protein